MAACKNLGFVLGEDWQIAVNCADGSGAPFTPADAIVEIAPANAASPVIRLQASLGTLLILNAQILIDVTAAQQAAAGVTASVYRYQVRAIKSDGAVSDQVAGQISVQPSLI